MTRTASALLDAALARLPAGALLVGYSGGVDSHLLLHLLSGIPAARARGLRAIHVDHGLQADSAAWARHCAAVCTELAVPMATARVAVEPAGDGLEAAARRARWGAYAQALAGDEILVLAQHLDDQAETVLLRLLRGAGPAGLAAMRPWSARADGLRVWRPWLGLGPGAADAAGTDADVARALGADADGLDPVAGPASGTASATVGAPVGVAAGPEAGAGPVDGGADTLRDGPALAGLDRAAILDLARADGLHWLEDPANVDLRHDRSVLRRQVLPALRARWPRAASQLAQAADRQADADALEGAVAAALLAQAATPLPGILRWPVLAQAPRVKRWAALRAWLAGHGVERAGADVLARIDAEVIGAAVDAGPRLDLGACVLRRYRDRLHALAPGTDAALDYRLDWDGQAPLALPARAGTLAIEPAPAAPLALVVASRRGGERLRLHPGGPRRDLRALLQEAGVPPWQRARWPVLWLAGEPVAFADLLLAPALAEALRGGGSRLRFAAD
jgi:tRNA(Ile)-lysidine synthase